MAKPVILAVDDDPDVLRAVERDLRRRYARDYRVLTADSAAVALDTLRQIELRDEPVGLLLVDQRMPRVDGVAFLDQARTYFPDAKRVLLTAYADTAAAIRAINDVKLDHYLMKPWDPPDERLYPVLDDLLDEWRATYRPSFEGLRIVGHRWSPRAHALRDFLARNQVPYRWIDVERDGEGERLLARLGAAADAMPVVVFPDGSWLGSPDPQAVAERIGRRTRAGQPFYDLIIVGAGPAGLAAAVYGASEGLRTAIIEREAPGGQAGMSSRIENYLGFPSGLSGGELARRAVAQASRFGAEMLAPQVVTGIAVEGTYRYVQLADGSELACHALLIATGVSYRRLEVPGLDRLAGAGVYYGAAMTEATACRGEDVYVVGGANSAGQAAMYFSSYARTVTMLVRGDGLSATMSQYLIDEIAARPNIAIRSGVQVVGAEGTDHLEAIIVEDVTTNERERLPTTSLFIFIGAEPRTDWLKEVVARDDKGFVLTGPDLPREGKYPVGWPLAREPFLLETSVPGIFAAGDVRSGSIKRVASGVGEGAIAVSLIHRHLAEV